MTWKPFHFLIVAIAGWMNRQQQQVIEYLRTEKQVLREKLGNKRLILNESQKVRLATAAAKLGKDLLRQFGTLFSPATLLRWQCVRRRLDSRRKLTDSLRGGSPRTQHGTAWWDKQPMRRHRVPAVEPRMSRLGKAGEEATSGASIRPASEPVMDNESERMDDASVESDTPRQFGSERCGLMAGGALVPSFQLGTGERQLSAGMDL